MEHPIFFKSPAELRSWFRKNGTKENEIWVGFYKKETGRKGITYPEAVDEALCFGWIDGIRKKLDDESYMNRFTPRKKTSYWSQVNIKRIETLMAEGRVAEAGLKAFRERDPDKTSAYSFEQKGQNLPPAFEKKFRANKKAWRYFSGKAPGYRRITIHWVMSAKQEATRLRRLETLILDSENERPIALLRRNP